MNKLKDLFQSEIPRINLVLQKELEILSPLVREVGEHVLLAGGKRLRPILTILTSRCLGGTREDIYPLACSLEFLHSATLIHDDILDNADLRRGRDSTHLVFGIKRAILAGDALLALANMIVARYDIPAMNFCVAEAILKTATGEVDEIDNLRNPEMDETTYLEIIRGKTAFLIQAACACGAMVSGASQDVQDQASSFGMNLGIAFQLVDDALDYAVDTQQLGKPHGSDIREGKITLPLILFLKTLPRKERQALLEKISSDSLSDEQMQDVVLSIQKAGLDQKVRQEADVYLKKSANSLLSLPASRERDLMQDMVELIKNRNF